MAQQMFFISSGDVNAQGNRALFTNFLPLGSINLDFDKKYQLSLAECTFPHPGGFHKVFLELPGLVPQSAVGSGEAAIVYVSPPTAAADQYSVEPANPWWIDVTAQQISAVTLRLTYLLDEPIPAPADPLKDFTTATFFVREIV